jgi:tetratricopeptide (TPR) repeat protein
MQTVACASASAVPANNAPIARPVLTRFASPYTYEWFVRAELLRDEGHLDGAIEAYRAALAGSDDDGHILARLGSALDEAGEHEQAQKVLTEALERDPASEAAWLARAELLERGGATEAAYDALVRAAQAAPESARVPLLLAKLLDKHGQPERARAVLQSYRKQTEQGGADVYRVELDTALLSGEPNAVFEATLPYRMGAPPKAAERLNRAAQLLLEKGRPALALRVIEFVPVAQREPPVELRILSAVGSIAALESWLVTHEPSLPEARIKAARSALLVGKVARASAIVESDRLLRPDTPGLTLLGAEIAQARGQYLVAADQFARVPANASVGSDARLGLSQALQALGLPELAAELSEARPADSLTVGQ